MINWKKKSIKKFRGNIFNDDWHYFQKWLAFFHKPSLTGVLYWNQKTFILIYSFRFWIQYFIKATKKKLNQYRLNTLQYSVRTTEKETIYSWNNSKNSDKYLMAPWEVWKFTFALFLPKQILNISKNKKYKKKLMRRINFFGCSCTLSMPVYFSVLVFYIFFINKKKIFEYFIFNNNVSVSNMVDLTSDILLN